MSPAFMLNEEPWLWLSPASGGPAVKCGLRHALLEAQEFEELAIGLPTQRPALLRQLLLPVVVDALGRPSDEREWVRWFHAGRWSERQRERLEDYLDEHSFDLFDAKRPFAQTPGLRTAKNETKGAGLLVATDATGNNVPLFVSRTEGEPPRLTPSQAAYWVLHAHCWDTAAIKTGAVGDPKAKGGITSGNPIGPLGQMAVTLPTGCNLFETLLLNIPIGSPLTSKDLPQWKRQDAATPQWQERMPQGLLELWTWQSRRIRLFPEETDEGLRVARVIVAAGDRMPHTPEFDPHTMWRLEPTGKRAPGKFRTTGKPSKQRQSPPIRPLRLRQGKAAWRGMDALLAPERERCEAGQSTSGFATSRLLDQLRGMRRKISESYPLRVELTGITYGNQSAVIEDVMFDALPLPLAALGADTVVHAAVVDVAGQAEKLASAVDRLSADLRRSVGAEPIAWNKGQGPGQLLLHALDPLVRRLLAGLRGVGEDLERIEAGQLAWEQLARREAWHVAGQLLQNLPASAYAGRTRSEGEGKPQRTYRAPLAETSFTKSCQELLPRAAAAHPQGSRHDDHGDDDA